MEVNRRRKKKKCKKNKKKKKKKIKERLDESYEKEASADLLRA